MSAYDAIEADGCATVSEATMRPCDVLPALVDCLDDLKDAIYTQHALRPVDGMEAQRLSGRIDDACAAFEQDSDACSDDNAIYHWERLHDLLNECAPAGYYFGSHWGDGACYGFWPVDNEGPA